MIYRCGDVGMLRLVWVTLIGCAVLTESVPFLNPIATHGKCQSSSQINTWKAINSLHTLCQVPKSFFKHMYRLGSLFSVIILLQSIYPWYQLRNKMQLRMTICLVLWTIHNLRRLWETNYMTIFGTSTMHLGGYVAGMVHYIAVPLTIHFANCISDPSSLDILVDIAAICFFFFANWVQFRCHEILYRLKRQQKYSNSSPIYEVPTESYFHYVCCPHYLAEICLYGCVWILLRFDVPALLMLLWVTTNLAIVANQQYCWYIQQHKQNIPRNWKRLLPMVW
jgi:3-oxo-5-alpha-steroid 4-dehydrogenase 3 / polyprenol reductase